MTRLNNTERARETPAGHCAACRRAIVADLRYEPELVAARDSAGAGAGLDDEQWNMSYRAGRAAGITEMVDKLAARDSAGLDVERLARAFMEHLQAQDCDHAESPEALALLAALLEPKP